jgi:lysophospholipase L1-like esterase
MYLLCRCSGYLHVPLAEFKINMEAMIKKLKSKGIHNIIVMTPPPVVDRMVKKADGTSAPTPTQADMKQYAAAAVAVASQQGVPSVDVFNIIQKFKNWQVQYWPDPHTSRITICVVMWCVAAMAFRAAAVFTC